MRANAASFYYPPVSKIANTATAEEAFSPAPTTEHSSWHSPVPYLFGGLSAMLGLIAFALLILACSYWKLSGEVNGGDRDVEGGSDAKGTDGNSNTQAAPPFEERLLVIMAGDARPTFLATPASNRPCSFMEHKDNVEDGNGEEVREIQLNQLDVHTFESISFSL